MLPFLKPKPMGSVVVAMKDDKSKTSHEEGSHPPELMAAAEDLISAVGAKDAQAVADAMYAAFQVCESYPHAEGEHIEDEG